MIPLVSASRVRSLRSVGFSRRTSSRKSARIRSPRSLIQLEDVPDVDSGDRPNPFCVRPDSSRLLTPTIAFHNKSLSSRPSSEAKLYMSDDIGSE
jgi:hypothetical protein